MAKKSLETLEERYRDDPVLLGFYKKKLLIRGWAGVLDDCEREYPRRKNPPWYAQVTSGGVKIPPKKNEGLYRPLQPPLPGFGEEAPGR